MEGGPVKTRPLRPLEAVRAFGLMLGGSIALAAFAVGSIAAAARACLSLRRPAPVALLGTAATALYAFVIRPWHLHWGAEQEDETRTLPGDELLPEGGTQILHAVTIDAPVEEVALARSARPGSRRLLQLRVAREPRRLPDEKRRPHPSRRAAPRAG
jgi:hypothetical protein